MLPRRLMIRNLKSHTANLVLIWSAIVLYRFSNYYANFLSSQTQNALLWLALAYTIFGSLYYLLPRDVGESHGLVVLRSCARFARDFITYLARFTKNSSYPNPRLERREKVLLLFMLVKLFFVPLILNFLFGNLANFAANLEKIHGFSGLLSLSSFNGIVYPLALALLFSIDTGYFVFGYLFEADFLDNSIRSVEPTMLGWVVALACYPPFNSVVSGYFGGVSDQIIVSSEVVAFILHLIVLLLYGIFVWATVALGTKCSNLTNRGIVARGPYRYVRHPAYISKNLAWFIALLPIMSVAGVVGFVCWAFIYFLRAITEERHLIQDPDYQAYCKKVKYRFIPFVY